MHMKYKTINTFIWQVTNNLASAKLGKQNNANTQNLTKEKQEKPVPVTPPPDANKHNHRNNLLKVDSSTSTTLTNGALTNGGDTAELVTVGLQVIENGKDHPQEGWLIAVTGFIISVRSDYCSWRWVVGCSPLHSCEKAKEISKLYLKYKLGLHEKIIHGSSSIMDGILTDRRLYVNYRFAISNAE